MNLATGWWQTAQQVTDLLVSADRQLALRHLDEASDDWDRAWSKLHELRRVADYPMYEVLVNAAHVALTFADQERARSLIRRCEDAVRDRSLDADLSRRRAELLARAADELETIMG